MIDYEDVRRIAKECRPRLIIAGASAYARIIDFQKFREIADEVGAYPEGRYGAYCRSGGSRAASKPHSVCTCDHNDNP